MGCQNCQLLLFRWVERIVNIDLPVVADHLTGSLVILFDKPRHASACSLLFEVGCIARRHREYSVLRKGRDVFGIQLCDKICALRLGADKILFQRFVVTLACEGHHTVDLFVEPCSVLQGGVLQTIEQYICL